jgi:hypothetical protein
MHIKRYDNCESRDIDIEYIVKLIQENKFVLPDSQREKEWVPEQNSYYIKSILENKPIGTFIFNINKKTNKYYILDGQHRINSIEKFYNGLIGVLINDSYIFYNENTQYVQKMKEKIHKQIFELDDEWKKIFLETKIYIKEYQNLTENEMSDIIDSINEGVKNDNINNKNNNIFNKESFYDQCGEIIFKKKFFENTPKKELLKKYIGYIGTIIDNYDNFVDNNDYKLLNIKHVIRYHNNIANKTNHNLIIDFLKILSDIFNNEELKSIFIDNEPNNIYINTTLYKIYETYKKDNIYDDKTREKIINKIKDLKDCKNKFKELLDIFDNTV